MKPPHSSCNKDKFSPFSLKKAQNPKLNRHLKSNLSGQVFSVSLLCICVCCLLSFTYAAYGLEETPNYNKSWIHMDVSNGGSELVSGQTWQVPVDYYLDPTEFSGPTLLYIWGAGPWLDVPDGKYVTEESHIEYPELSKSVEIVSPGRGMEIFTFTVPQGLALVKKNNPVLLVAGFREEDGTYWPWQIRAETSFIDNGGYFEILSDVPGNLFTYNEQVALKIRLKNIGQSGQEKTLDYVIFDTTGAIVDQGQKEFTAQQAGQEIYIYPQIEGRGVFLIEIDIPAWEKRHTTFARIPDLITVTQNNPIRFGMTTNGYIVNEQLWAIAQRLGLSICRRFSRWYDLQPEPDLYDLDTLENEVENANQYGIQTWLCIIDPPPFAYIGKAQQADYHIFDCDLEMWQDLVSAVTTKLNGKLFGWEWLNEITPGELENQVEMYVQLCKIGTETAKSIDSNITTLLAGGIFPRSFRNQILSAGAGDYIDVLPIHYQNGSGILEARQDLDIAGYTDVVIYDDESARGLNAWAVPPLEELQHTQQCDWILRLWPDELAAGCEKIIYFGGEPEAAGNFSYLLDDCSPRPVAATIAVFISKIANAKFLGSFLLQNNALFHLFERDNEAILIASTYEKAGQNVLLESGNENLIITDYQGNETILPTSEGEAEIYLTQLPVFIEHANLDVLKGYIVPTFQVFGSGDNTSLDTNTSRQMIPSINIFKGSTGKVVLNLANVYDYNLSGNINVELPDGWNPIGPITFQLDPQQEISMEVLLEIFEDVPENEYTIEFIFNYDQEQLPQIEKYLIVSVLSTDKLGNLITNGDFESPPELDAWPDGWNTNGTTKTRVSSEGLGDGLGQYVLQFENSDDWVTVNRNLELQGEQTYLYTAWICNENMVTGSNMTQYFTDGSQLTLFDVQVIACGYNNPYWQLFTCRKRMPIDIETVSFTPFAKGAGWAMWDNIRLTLFEGTDYAAEAHKVETAPNIDGILDENEWVTKCSIPLIGSNQITDKQADYIWTPDNMSAVCYLMWDEDNLYIAVKIRDDVHYQTASGSSKPEDISEGDSLIIGIDPTHRGIYADIKALAYYISTTATVPGTLQSAGSQYEPGICIYEMSIPLTEIDVIGGIGTKIGFSVQLNDNDGDGKSAQINWGDGIFPGWSPENFGVVTFVK